MLPFRSIKATRLPNVLQARAVLGIFMAPSLLTSGALCSEGNVTWMAIKEASLRGEGFMIS
jgi:hypothetical protein